MLTYPTHVEYNEAVQHPKTAFTNPDLRPGIVSVNNLGLPIALSGGFALTYKLTVGGKRDAIRCFHRQVPSAEEKYAAISKVLTLIRGAYFVRFRFESRGIKVKGSYFPIVCMDWVDGPTLGIFLENNVQKQTEVQNLREQFQKLASFLEGEAIAHGDIQNGNVIITRDGIRLIDYDGMYVPGLKPGNGSETGHKHFQHPDRDETSYGPLMDRFSFIVVDLSLNAVRIDPSLYKKYNEGGETIMFRANDFYDPPHSVVFQRLLAISELKVPAQRLAAICANPIDKVPSLTDFLAGRNIPAAPTISVVTVPPTITQVPQPSKTYISPYKVVEAKNYAEALHYVGSRVELIGQIVEVKQSQTRHGKPYVFINFGPWRGNILKITIWSEGLSQFTEAPGNHWVGRWVSVVGLVDPPYTSRRYKYTHLSITVGHSSELNFISESEAIYRLGSAGKPAPQRNRSLIEQILGKGSTTITTQFPTGSPVSRPSTASPSNQQIVSRLKQSHASGSTWTPPTGPTPARTSPRPASKTSIGAKGPLISRIPWWVWVLVVLFFFLFLSDNKKSTRDSQPTRPVAPISRAPTGSIGPTPPSSPETKSTAADNLPLQRDRPSAPTIAPGTPKKPNYVPQSDKPVTRNGAPESTDQNSPRTESGTTAIQIPPNASLDYSGRRWTCNKGYYLAGNECRAVQIPPNALLDYTGHRWICSRGYYLAGNECRAVQIPPNASLDYTGHGWICSRGYFLAGNECRAVQIPPNASLDYTGHSWICSRGYFLAGNECRAVQIPPNASLDYTGHGWTCKKGHNQVGNNCVPNQ